MSALDEWVWWILRDRQPVSVKFDEYVEWAKGDFEQERRVGLDHVGDVKVSTVFMTVDHALGGSEPILFETMVFGGDHDQDCWRYSTWGEAAAGHRRVVEALQQGSDPNQ